jgi:hypothetical protein
LTGVAQQAATKAIATRTAVVAVGGATGHVQLLCPHAWHTRSSGRCRPPAAAVRRGAR